MYSYGSRSIEKKFLFIISISLDTEFFSCRNYVVQFVFEIHVPWATAEIIDQLEGSYVDLSIQKYSSNVVEKCLKYAGEERRLSIIQELINNPRLDQIMQDPYGNYVIQAALNLSKVCVFSSKSTKLIKICRYLIMLYRFVARMNSNIARG